MLKKIFRNISKIKRRFKSIYWFYLPLLSFLFFVSCTSNRNWGKVVNWDAKDISDTAVQKDYPDAGAVILLDEGTTEISDAGEIDFTYIERHRVVKILNTSGYSYANVSIGYNDKSEIEMIEARTIGPDGKITVLEDDNVFDVTLYPGFIFFSDQRAKIFTFPAVEVGSILEYRYRMSVAGETLINNWYFQNHIPTKHSRFILRTPMQWNIDYKLFNIDIEDKTHKIPSMNRTTRTWEARDLPAIPEEIAMPSLRDISARIEISPMGFNKWSDVARWYHNLSGPQMVTNEQIQKLAQKLTAGIYSEKEKVKKIFEWVRDNIRYIAVSIGIGGFRPHSSAEILKNRYGDCKDMSTLLCSAAKAVGITVHEVLISTKPNGHIDTSLVSPFQFNHVIAYYPMGGDSGLWLDATKKGSPFGYLPWYNQDRLAFVINDQGKGTFKTTPTYVTSDNVVSMEWKVNLDSGLVASVEGKNLYWGAPASEIRQGIMNMNAKQCRIWLEDYLSNRCPGVELQFFTISNVDTVNDPLTIDYQFKSELFVARVENFAVINLASILLMDLPEYFLSKKRDTPVEFHHGNIYQLGLDLNLPKGWHVQEPFRDDTLSSPYGKIVWNWETSGNRFQVQNEYKFLGLPISQESYEQYYDFLQAMSKNDMIPAILVKK